MSPRGALHAEGPNPRRFVDLTAAAILIQTCGACNWSARPFSGVFDTRRRAPSPRSGVFRTGRNRATPARNLIRPSVQAKLPRRHVQRRRSVARPFVRLKDEGRRVEVKRLSSFPLRRCVTSFAGSCFSAGSALGRRLDGDQKNEAEQSRKRPDRCDATGTATLANSPHSSSREGRFSTDWWNLMG